MKLPLLQNWVERGYALHCEINKRQVELDAIKRQLKATALARIHEQVPLVSGAGRQWIMATPQAECRIVLPAPRLLALLDPREIDWPAVQALVGDQQDDFFRKETVYRVIDKDNFREQVRTRFGESEAEQLLQLCSVPVEPRAVWCGSKEIR